MSTFGQRVPNSIAQTEHGPHTVAAKTGHALQIARVCQTWALIERELMYLYGLFMGVDIPSPTGIPRIHPTAFQVFDTLPALLNRTELLQRLAHWKAEPGEIERVDAAVARVRSAAKVRNRVVHGLWATCAEYPNDLLLVTPTEGMYRYREKDLAEVVTLLMDVHLLVSELFADVYTRLHRPRTPQTPPPPPAQEPSE